MRRPSTVGWSLDPAVRHLNHASFGAVPDDVASEQHRLRQVVESNPTRWFATLPERIAQARAGVARQLAVDADRLAFVLNASAGASVVYDSLLHRGPVDVMTTDHGYGAVSMGAQRLAARSGGRATCVEVPLAATAGEVLRLLTEAMERERPRMLVIDQITSATARAFPAEEICQVARTLGVLTLVDGAHAPAATATPVVPSADYWVGNLHKFACAPRGAAVLVVRGGGDELFPSIESWGTPQPFPQRFDSQGTLDLTPWVTAPYAWDYLDDRIGWDRIRSSTAALLDAGCELVARELGGFVDDPLPDVGQPVGWMRLLRLPEPLGRTRATADALRVPFVTEAGIVAAFTSFQQHGYLRLSAHAYSSPDDFDRVASVGVPVLHRWPV